MMGAIPYTSRVRPDTGLTNGRLGTALFILSEIMFYGGLFSAYVFLRSSATEWPPAGVPIPQPTGIIALVIHLAAAATLTAAWLRVRNDSRSSAVGLSLVTAIFATGFIATIGAQHRMLVGQDAIAATSTYHAIYFLISDIHRAHVAAGALLAAYLIGPGRTLQLRDSMAYANRVTCIAWYWLFLAAAWVVTFVLFHTV